MRVTLYTGPGCGPCYGLKAALTRAGVDYVELPAADAPDVDRWRALGWQTPVVQYAGIEFSGFDPAKVQALIDAAHLAR